MHDWHEQHPSYSPEQVLHDGCGECAERSASDDHGLSKLDMGNFAKAWRRAAEWNLHGLTDIAEVEVPLLRTLWSVQIQLQRFGMPIGQLPVESVIP